MTRPNAPTLVAVPSPEPGPRTVETTSIADRIARIGDAPAWWAEKRPDALALRTVRGDLTWTQYEAAIERTRAELAARGVRSGDRVQIVSENTAACCALFFALNRLDAWVTVVNARMSAAEVDALIAFAHPRLVVCPTTGEDAAAGHGARLGAETWEDPDLGAMMITPADETSEARPEADMDARTAALMFTSGTTGTPKGVMLSNATLRYQAHSQGLNRGLSCDDVVYMISPLSHLTGLSSNLLSAAAAGAAMSMPLRFDPEAMANAIRTGEVTFVVAVPQVFQRLLDWAEAHGVDLLEGSRLRAIGAGGAPLDPGLQRRVLAKLGVPVSNGYGASEMVPIARVPPGQVVDANVIGYPCPGIEVRIAGEDGEAVPDGQPGEIWARGPARMTGYFDNPKATEEVTKPGGWLATGDMGQIDEAGMIRIVGRKKELIIRSGFNVYPSDVEAVLSDHPAVAASAVLGRPVEGNEEVVAFVQTLPGWSVGPAELTAWLRERLVPYKVPAEIRFKELPIGPTGKILKSALKPEL